MSALAHDGTSLYAGGSFSMAGGAPASRIARWDGSNWSSLGSGMNGTVEALLIVGTDLYAGGMFSLAGGAAANRIARWDGENWSSLGSGMGGTVRALVYDGTNLYAGGQFGTAGGVAANNVAMWNGTTWTNLGDGVNASVGALFLDGTGLYAGGVFTNSGSAGANRIAKWNGTTWTNLGSGILGQASINSITGDGTNLYVVGTFTNAGGVTVKNAAMWDGANWNILGSGLSHTTWSVLRRGSTLYAGGLFSAAGDVTANAVASWNGSAWTNLGSGLDIFARALAHDGESLYAGGFFFNAGNVPASNVAKWGPTAIESSGVVPSSGLWSGGYPVAISGANLGAGDVTNVTLCGVSVASIVSQSSTQVVVIAGAASAVGLGDVVVYSTSHGATTDGNAFEYLRQHQADLLFAPTSPQAYLTTNGLSVSGGSGTGAVSYAVLDGPGAIVDDVNLAVTAPAGLIQIRATKAQDALYFEASATGTVAAAKVGQTIAFPAIAPVKRSASVGLVATASSGLPVSFAVGDGPGSISGGTNLTFSGAGDVSVTASQAGDDVYAPAPDATTVFKVFQVIPENGPFAGGNAVLVTNGTFGTITNVLVDGAVAAAFDQTSAAGFMLTLPAAAVTGVVDIVVQTAEQGDLTLGDAYTYNPAGEITTVAPTSGSWTGGYAVVISGTHLSDPSDPLDLTAVTLCGVPAVIQPGWSATQIVVIAGAAVAPGLGDVVVHSTSHGATSKANAFTYVGEQVIDDFRPGDGSHLSEGATVELSATATSGLPVSFEVLSGPGSIDGGTHLTFTGAGTVLLVASQPGNEFWYPAAPLTNACVAHPLPVAGPVTIWRASNQVLKVTDQMLMTNSTDSSLMGLNLFWVSDNSANGGTVALSGRWVTYHPLALDDDSPDYFSFRVRNFYGGEAEGTATVLVLVPPQEGPTLNVSSIETHGQDVRVRFVGIPGRIYDVQVSTDLESGIWTKVGESITIGALGYVDFNDENVPPGDRFYRTARPE